MLSATEELFFFSFGGAVTGKGEGVGSGNAALFFVRDIGIALIGRVVDVDARVVRDVRPDPTGFPQFAPLGNPVATRSAIATLKTIESLTADDFIC